MNSGELCYISSTSKGLTIKESDLGLFGRTVFKADVDTYAYLAMTLHNQQRDDLTPADMRSPALKAVVNEILHYSSLKDISDNFGYLAHQFRLYGGQMPEIPDEDEYELRSKIIYDLSDSLGEANHPIRNAHYLKNSKQEIYSALDEEIASLEPFSPFSQETQKRISQLQVLRIHVGDFQVIDPEDAALVHEINFGKRFELFRTHAGMDEMKRRKLNQEEEKSHQIFMRIIAKYLARGAKEQGRI